MLFMRDPDFCEVFFQIDGRIDETDVLGTLLDKEHKNIDPIYFYKGPRKD